MSFSITYQTVGVYAFFPELKLDGITETSTIKDVLDKIQEQKSQGMDMWEYLSDPLNPGPGQGAIVSSIGYRFVEGTSATPPNSKNADNGWRVGRTRIIDNPGDKFFRVLVWQYYRGVSGRLSGSDETFIVQLPSLKQPLFNQTGLFEDLDKNRSMIPQGFEIDSYVLTHRQVVVPKPNDQLELYRKLEKMGHDFEQKLLAL